MIIVRLRMKTRSRFLFTLLSFFFTFKNGLGRRCNVISATFPDSTFESFRHDSGISHSEGNLHEEGAV